MNQLHSNTDDTSRKRGAHLTLDQRGAIQILKRQGLSLRAIADTVGCAHATVWYELRRGTPQRTSSRGRIPLYMAKRGQAAYNEHRTHCRKTCKLDNDLFEPFMQWLVKQIREKHWSLDVCVGYAKLHQLFPKEAMVCTKTLYNMLWNGKLPLTVFEVPRVLSRKQHRKWNRKNKRMLGRSIEERPAIVDEHEELGHWEADTVVDRILFLEGLPNLQSLGKLLIGENVVECLEGDLKYEREIHRPLLVETIALMEELQDYVSRDMLEHLLEHCEEAIDWLETQQNLIKCVTLPNYLQAYMDPGSD